MALDLREKPTVGPLQERLADAALACIERWGVAKTTLDDVAREAGCSRATIYRAFPGGKDAMLEAVVGVEVDRFFARLAAAVDGVTDLEDLLVAGMTATARLLQGHAALRFLFRHEPEIVLPRVSFDNAGTVLHRAVAFAAPLLAPHVGDERAVRAAEWVARLVLSYTMCPSDRFDMTDEGAVRRLVATFVVPGVRLGAEGAQLVLS